MAVGTHVLIIGGSFDPIHIAHLQMAKSAQAHCMCDEVWFLPSGEPWQKGGTHAAATHRVAMVQAAIEGAPSWRVDTTETDRTGPSYAIDTLSDFTERYPLHRFTWAMGADQALNLPSWKHWASLFDHARFAVADRPGFDTAQLPKALQAHWQAGHMFRMPMTEMAVSSTQIRRWLAQRQTNNIDIARTAQARLEAHLHPAVLAYIDAHRLYSEV